MNRLIFQLVLQFTELTWGGTETREAGQAPSPWGVGGAEGPERVRGDQPSAQE